MRVVVCPLSVIPRFLVGFALDSLVTICWERLILWDVRMRLDIIEPPHDKTNRMACAPSEDSDQPGHPPSLISVVAVRMKKTWVLCYPLSAQRRLITGRMPKLI